MVAMEVTGYCECGICCNWKRSWWRLGMPVVASGPQKGQRKDVGITAAGTKAQVGTVAADTRYYPMGTIVWVPDYGWGRVEDRGGAIKGQKLDLFFNSHQDALHWGRQRKTVQVWFPR
jgi:3D (Asp-Asp-Asp) domain-containing protein